MQKNHAIVLLSVFFLWVAVVVRAQQSCMDAFFAEHPNLLCTDTSYSVAEHDEFVKTVIARQEMAMQRNYSGLQMPDSSKPAPQPCFLAIDTVNGRAQILAQDGTYLADVHIALVDSTWYMWLSVDPLADKYPGSTPYIYCNGNPIMHIDPDGRTWTDADGNEIKDHSQIRAYIFYNPEEFSPQTMAMYERLESQYGKGSVALSNVTTEAEFAEDWSEMNSRQIAEVNINHHGNNQTLILNPTMGEYITSTGDGRSNLSGTSATNVSGLPLPAGDLSKARLNLNTCHSNDPSQHPLKGEKITLLMSFFRYFPFQSIRGTKAGISYGFQKVPHPQSNKFLWLIPISGRNEPVWDFLKRGY